MVDLDIQKFFDSVDHNLMVKAVEANTDQPWVVLYVKRWLSAPIQHADGSLDEPDRGLPRVRRSRPYWPISFSTMGSTCGWTGRFRMSGSKDT